MDSGAFFALLVAEDGHHVRALEHFRAAHDARWRLVTTNAVVYETHGLLVGRARAGRDLGLRFLEMLIGDAYRVERASPADEARAEFVLRRHSDKDYSLCDALSFVVMERLRIVEAIAFDRHFREYGKFTVL